MLVVENLRRLKEEIADTARACGRKPNDIKLLVISKGVSWEMIALAYNEGYRDFGENRLQEALLKIDRAPNDCRWHFVGTLQKNKVKKVVAHFEMIHSVDSLDLAHAISEASLEKKMKMSILLQVNTSGEKSKHGMSPDDCFRNFESIMSMPGLNVQGLMTMAPLLDDENAIRSTFENLRILRDQIVTAFLPPQSLPLLSMGMSHDFKIAISEGSTMLRIGTKIWS